MFDGILKFELYGIITQIVTINEICPYIPYHHIKIISWNIIKIDFKTFNCSFIDYSRTF